MNGQPFICGGKMCRFFTPEEDTRAESMRLRGMSCGAIALKLGRAEVSVRTRLQILARRAEEREAAREAQEVVILAAVHVHVATGPEQRRSAEARFIEALRAWMELWPLTPPRGAANTTTPRKDLP